MTKAFLIAASTSAFLLTAAPQQPPAAPAPEISTHEDAPVFQSKVTLIEVPVVVRDKKGKAVGTLRQEDFQLSDKGKPQVITKFSIEKYEDGKAIASVPTPDSERTPGDKGDMPPVMAPDHFIGLLFDDVHMDFANVVYARTAAQKLVASGLKPADRVAIFTTSGQVMLDFTDDGDLLNKALMKLAPHPISHASTLKCPEMSLFQADQIANYHDELSTGVAAADYLNCFGPTPPDVVLAYVKARAKQVYFEGRPETAATVVSLKAVIRKMGEMPGQRTLILASPGFFLMQDQLQDEGPAIDLAIRSGVVINALDLKGVQAPVSFSAEVRLAPAFAKETLNQKTAAATSGTLDDLASGTGGRSFHENDQAIGLQELVPAPEAYYLLGFSPQNLKPDGTFHSLKVSLKTTAGMSLQARRGYYAPDHLATAEEDAKEEVSQALFSRDEMNDIPVVVNTRFFKASETEARLTVTSHVDIRKLRFRKADGRNVDNIRFVCALFDRDGNFVQAVAKTIEMNLLDASLESNKLSDGIPVRSDFTVPPGTYVIRLVLRDAEGETMTAQNSAVKIP